MEAFITPLAVAVITLVAGYLLGGRGKARLDDQAFYRNKIADLEGEIVRLNRRIDGLVDEQAQDKKRWSGELDRTHDTLSTALARSVERAEAAETEVRRLSHENKRLMAMVGSLAEGVPDNT